MMPNPPRMANPYEPPKAVVSDAWNQPPRGWLRAKWTFFVTAVALGIGHIPDIVLRQPVSRVMLLFDLCILALCVTLYAGRKIWLLDSRKGPLWIDVLLWTLAAGGLTALVFVREALAVKFNLIYVSLPILVVNAGLGAICFVTEARKRVSIYMGPRSFVFLAEKNEVDRKTGR